MTYAETYTRCNAALNFFADTTDVDYLAGLSAAEVMQEDSVNKSMAIDIKELRQFGY